MPAMNLLVTGGCGFIGANFVHEQRRQYPQDRLVVLDALTYCGNLRNLESLSSDPGVAFVRGDICDADRVAQLLRDDHMDAIVHFAAESHVDRSILGPLPFVQTNVVGTTVLLEAARKAQVQRFLHVSTDEVYGTLGPTDPPFTEETPLAPRSPYAASKAASDHLALAYAHTYGLPVVVTRCSNNYGPFQFPEKLLPLMILSALADQPLPVYGDGQQVRDWIYVEDHCRGIDAALRRGRPGAVYNFGGRAERTNLEMVHAILELVGKPRSLIRFVADRLGHDRRYAVECSRAEHELDWHARWSLDDGLRETVRWYREHPSWCQSVQSGEYRTFYDRNYTTRLAESTEVAQCG
jgi:dTDP-glucose 4,6-dehydratase